MREVANIRIEICGAIASGKTTLASAYSKSGYTTEFEDFSKISMLDDFYSDPISVSFETEISFTLQHYYQVKKALLPIKTAVCDFSSVDDYAFALAILNEKEMEIYNQIFAYILDRVGKPQKLIRLNASADELLLRIENRGRTNEQSINKSSLVEFERCLDYAITRYYNDVPIVMLNTEQYFPSHYSKEFLGSL